MKSSAQYSERDTSKHVLRPSPYFPVYVQLAFCPACLQLLDIARCAKESEAAVLRAAYERRSSQHARTKELGDTGSETSGNELWRVPPPPVMEGVEGKGGASSPKALHWADVSTLAALCAGKSKGIRRDTSSGLVFTSTALVLCAPHPTCSTFER